jgi:hypothetical protein
MEFENKPQTDKHTHFITIAVSVTCENMWQVKFYFNTDFEGSKY